MHTGIDTGHTDVTHALGDRVAVAVLAEHASKLLESAVMIRKRLDTRRVAVAVRAECLLRPHGDEVNTEVGVGRHVILHVLSADDIRSGLRHLVGALEVGEQAPARSFDQCGVVIGSE